MKTTDLLGSGTALATAIFTATNATVPSAGAEASTPNSRSTFVVKDEDIVDVSQLASSLDGDGLTLFNSLSPNSRQDLADLVASGKMKADELNDALSGLLKSARKTAFWDEAGEAQHALSDEVKSAQSGLEDSVKENAHRIAQMESASSSSQTGYLTGADAERVRAQFANLRPSPAEAKNARQAQTLTRYSMTYEYAAQNSSSASEAAAAQKLKGTGFSSSDFDAALRNLSLDAVNKMIAQG